MYNAKVGTDRWVRCGNCNHKLGRAAGEWNGKSDACLEIKCHSCKQINYIKIGNESNAR